MYAYINELSMQPSGVVISDNWYLIKEVMDISFELKDRYLLEKLRVPSNFMEIELSNSNSIKYFLDSEELDYELKNLLYDFLENRVDQMDEETREILDQKQEDKVYYSYLDGHSSDLLTEAYVMDAPVISFATKAAFKKDVLKAELRILKENGEETKKDIEIHNVFQPSLSASQQAFLIEWKKKIVFKNSEWKPTEQAIWNDYTKTVLDELEFPQSIVSKTEKKEGKKAVDKKSELLTVGRIVAELNGWAFDLKLTKLNKNSGQLRSIFKSKNSRRAAYLSIDVEKHYGTFELLDEKGVHLGEIKFEGSQPENADSSHNIRLK